MTMQDFPTQDVLSTITGRLMGDIGGVYLVLNWMTGESVYTHQIPRIGREAQAFMVAHDPRLVEAVAEAEQVNRTNYLEWRDRWIERYGPTISVPKFSNADHEAIDPMSELAEKVHPDRIVIVKA